MSLPLGSQDHVYPANYEILLVNDQPAKAIFRLNAAA